MKRLKKTIAFLLVLCCVSICFAGCKKKDDGVIRLNEVTHSIFYAPLYLAINLGFMEEEGLTIELTNGGGSDTSMAALLSNSADVALLGPETIVYVKSQGSTNHPIIFGQLTKRDGSFLVSRNTSEEFSWDNLTNTTIIGGRRGGLPAMTLEWIVNQHGYTNGTNINLNLELAFNMTVPAFEGGTGDYCTMFEPTASEYEKAGKGKIVASLGEASGEIPYTCFMATSDYMKKNPEKLEAFLRAIQKAYNYIYENDPSVVAQGLVASFEGVSLESIEASIISYKNIDAWMSTPVMQESAFNRLLEVMKNAGEIDEDCNVKFSSVVDNTFASKIAA